jgi:hypothetical protein
VAGSGECGDEPPGSGATELVSYTSMFLMLVYWGYNNIRGGNFTLAMLTWLTLWKMENKNLTFVVHGTYTLEHRRTDQKKMHS